MITRIDCNFSEAIVKDNEYNITIQLSSKQGNVLEITTPKKNGVDLHAALTEWKETK